MDHPQDDRLIARLQAALVRSERRSARIGLLSVKDASTPGAAGRGPAILRRIEDSVRAGDLVLKAGPGEQLVLLDPITGPQELMIVATRLLGVLDRLADPLEEPEQLGHIGGFLADVPYDSAEALIERAVATAVRAAAGSDRIELLGQG